MASRRFRSKPCAYCATGISTPTGDHVLPRSLVPTELRADLPKVPCCETCNNRKSRTEHYVATVLPFGGRHATARETLEAVRPRLIKNQRLARELAAGMQDHVTTDGTVGKRLLVRTEMIEAFADDLVRGLSCHHWGERLTEQGDYFSALLHPEFDEMLSRQLAALNGATVDGDLADGHLLYFAKRAPAEPIFALWRIEFLGGAQFGNGGPDLASAFWAIAGNPAMVAKFKDGILESELKDAARQSG